MRKFKRLYAAVLVLAVPAFSVLLTGTAEALRVANHCEPSFGDD
ncbi:hypothetical protein FHS43_002987 [Streptosporangium becharense]|uniref:Uncharacterized protein n=1 Tax=Streptosporangium becharense TaxID=1816182 RepID=A0A7W9IKK4_9ACTN|nr:hypothetical protein [Streptosporangium becharense]MBB2911714.1 hypothetical protein [Streptosporangium becharense]MBB5822468.1 hypothetical protein [Streptosporangium becharense]